MSKSRTITRRRTHPGEFLRELMDERSLSINRLARELHVPVMRISDIVNGKRAVTPDTALRLARYFAMTPQFWLNAQAAYDLSLLDRAAIEREIWPCDEPAA